MKKLTILLFSFIIFLALGLLWGASRPNVPEEGLLIAHRGASGYAPEHTFAAYDKAIELNGDYLEIDLQQTSDGVLVAMHDETVDRTTDGSGRVNEFTFEELKDLDAGSWFNEAFPEYADEEYVGEEIVSLQEIFERYGPEVNYYIETKFPDHYSNMEENLIQLLEQYHLLDNVTFEQNIILQSFDSDSLRRLHEMNPSIPLIQLIHFGPNQAYLNTQQINTIQEYAYGIGVNLPSMNESFGRSIRSEGLELHVYTVNSYSLAVQVFNQGATGIFTDTLKEFK